LGLIVNRKHIIKNSRNPDKAMNGRRSSTAAIIPLQKSGRSVPSLSMCQGRRPDLPAEIPGDRDRDLVRGDPPRAPGCDDIVVLQPLHMPRDRRTRDTNRIDELLPGRHRPVEQDGEDLPGRLVAKVFEGVLLLCGVGSVVLIEPDRCDILADCDLVREPEDVQVVPQRPHIHLAGKSSEMNTQVLPDMIVDLRPDLLIEKQAEN